MADTRQALFDRKMGALFGVPDMLSTKATTVRAVTPLVGDAQTFIVQTYRHLEMGDTVFLEYVDEAGSIRLVLPPEVTRTIARQRAALTGRARSRGAKAAADDRKARGILPGFAKKRNTRDRAEQDHNVAVLRAGQAKNRPAK